MVAARHRLQLLRLLMDAWATLQDGMAGATSCDAKTSVMVAALYL